MILTKYFKSIFICNLVNLWLFDNQYNFFNNLMYVINWAPFFVQNIHLNRSIYWNVWMKHFSQELNLRRSERIVFKSHFQFKNDSFPHRIFFSIKINFDETIVVLYSYILVLILSYFIDVFLNTVGLEIISLKLFFFIFLKL